jgi:hypothetical protein
MSVRHNMAAHRQGDPEVGLRLRMKITYVRGTPEVQPPVCPVTVQFPLNLFLVNKLHIVATDAEKK